MVPLTSLWIPIILSAIAAFVLSSIIHMMLGYHKNDYRKLPAEDEVMEALRKAAIPPGDYAMPRAGSLKEMKSPAYLDKMKRGPVAVMTVMRSGTPSMSKNLVQWFIYCVVVGIFAAYVAGRALAPGAPFLAVLRFAGCTAFAGYALALWQQTIWYNHSWIATLKSTFDGLLYSLATGAILGWLWPH